MSFQVWQITSGSLVTNTAELGIKFIEAFGKLSEAREFLCSDSFLATHIKDKGLPLAQFFIVPENHMFVILPARLDPAICISDLDSADDNEGLEKNSP